MRQTLPFLAIALSLSLLSPASAAYVLVQDFEGGTLGAPVDTVPGVYGNNNSSSLVVAGLDGQAGSINGAAATGFASSETGIAGLNIADNSSGTVFFQMSLPTTNTSNDPDVNIGLLESGNPTPNVFNSDYRFQIRSDGTNPVLRSGNNMALNGAGGGEVILQPGLTYDVFAFVDSTADVMDLYIASEDDSLYAGAPTLVGSSVFSNPNFFGTAGGDVGTLSFQGFNNSATVSLLVDNVFADNTGLNLASPVAATAVPEPGSALLGLAAIGGIAARRRRNRK